MKKKLIAALLLGAIVLPVLQGCFPMVAAGVTTGVLATFDRRTLGAQAEDETIEWKASARLGEKLGDKAHINITSFNRKALITGEVASSEAKASAETIVSEIPNVQGVYNELAVAPLSAYSTRSNDAFITSKIKSRSVDNGKFNPVHVKVVTEAGTAYLLGMVTEAEADAAIGVARTTAGVKKVVKLLEIITPEKARELDITQKKSTPKETKAQ